MTVTEDIRYVGVNDTEIDLFEGQYRVPNGISYNSYVIVDETVAVMDTVDARFGDEWLVNIKEVLGEKAPDYLVVQHMEPDHSANILRFAEAYPQATIVSSSKAFAMMKNFFGTDFADRRMVVADGDTLSLGKHELQFVAAPMVHWPEVMVTYDKADKVLFSADGFGKFGIPEIEDNWDDEARRYYIGIVGKYGAQVQALLKKAAALDIQTICPLHGPILTDDLAHYIRLYDTWSSYRPECDGTVVTYASVYGNTAKAAEYLAQKLREKSDAPVKVYDLCRCDMSEAVADAFRYSRLVLASVTYNADVFPPMRSFIDHLSSRGFRNRTVAYIENGSWAPIAAKVMREAMASCKDMTEAEQAVKILSAPDENAYRQLEALADELCRK